MKKTKNLFLLVLAIMFFANLTVISGKAQGPLDGEIVDGSLLTSDESAFDEKPLILQNSLEGDIIPFGTYLSNGISGITDKGGGVVYVSGHTNCNRTSDKVQVYLYLERLGNSGWEQLRRIQILRIMLIK